jgi:hypothetical protein
MFLSYKTNFYQQGGLLSKNGSVLLNRNKEKTQLLKDKISKYINKKAINNKADHGNLTAKLKGKSEGYAPRRIGIGFRSPYFLCIISLDRECIIY